MLLVLVIEDDLEDYELFCDAIKTFTEQVHCLHARNGKEGYDLLSEQLSIIPDYIFLDVNMPIMGGKDFLTKVKAHDQLKDIPVIMFSTTNNQAEIQSFLSLGAQDFIIKPPGFYQLVDRLKKIFVH
jgi:CheY-like chemotaxis protein